ncbi:MAG: UTP--glucose-1-phosphate uridylyltransferase GalU [Acidobacteria bacterium]|nr:UTP--glucose-1-phosphate uridylyltransferase GalU [Acidobacteriota bacterium]
MNIRKAVIPAAGFGTRFLPATKAQPKEMLCVLDKPLIQYCVEEAVASGLTHICIITGRGKSAVEDHFDRNPELEALLEEKKKDDLLKEVRRISGLAEICSVRQKEMLGLGHAVLAAADYVGREPFAVLLPDDIYDCAVPCPRQLMDVAEAKNASTLALGRTDAEGTKKYGIIKPRPVADRVYQLLDMIEKPGPERAFSDLAILGRYVFTPEIFDMIRETPPDHRGEIQITDAIRKLVDHQDVYGVEYEGDRYDAGDKIGQLEAILALALKREDYREALLGLLKSHGFLLKE